MEKVGEGAGRGCGEGGGGDREGVWRRWGRGQGGGVEKVGEGAGRECGEGGGGGKRGVFCITIYAFLSCTLRMACLRLLYIVTYRCVICYMCTDASPSDHHFYADFNSLHKFFALYPT